MLCANFGDSALEFELRAYLNDLEERLETGSELRKAIFAAFKAAGIEIPYPQRDVHMVGDATAASHTV